MASQTTVRSLVTSSVRNPFSLSSRYICQPCLATQQQQQQQNQNRNQNQRRTLHQHIKAPTIPKPTSFVPDVPTFLTLIGRGMSAHAAKFTSWESFFKLSSEQIKELGIEPARNRRYLLRWREKFRKGQYGIGGDFQHVKDGIAELRVLEVPSLRETNSTDGKATDQHVGAANVSTSITPGMQKLILNTPAGTTSYTALLSKGQTSADLKKPDKVQLKDGRTIVGSYLRPVKGSNGSVATLAIVDGLWEHKRGRKLFGGERRRAETLHKMRVEERRKKNE